MVPSWWPGGQARCLLGASTDLGATDSFQQLMHPEQPVNLARQHPPAHHSFHQLIMHAPTCAYWRLSRIFCHIFLGVWARSMVFMYR